MTALLDLLPLAGFRVLYRPGVICPACAGRNWHVGRATAECARCATALPLAPAEAGEPAHG